MFNYKKLGYICREFRVKYLRMTQGQVAEELGLTVSSISMFENGNSRSTDILLFYLLKGLPVNVIRDIKNLKR